MKESRPATHGRWSIAILIWIIDRGLGTMILLSATSSCSIKDTKFQQYFAQGQVLYEKNCSNCHQKSGTGLGRLYPPLASSDYFISNFNNSLCIMKYGIQGEIIVNGKSYNKLMPGIPSLTELEIAEITTYIGNSWGQERGLIDVAKASEIMSKCSR